MPFMLAAALLAAAPLQDTTRLTLEAAVRLALERAPAVEASRQSLLGASSTVREARALRWPQLGADGSVFRHEEPMVVAPIHGLTPGGTLPQFDRTLLQGSVGLGWTLFDGGARQGRIGQARALEQAAQAETAVTAQTVIAAVAQAYAEVQAAEEAVTAEAIRRSSLAAELTRVERFLTEGRAAPLERLRVNAAVSAAEADWVSALARVQVAAALLARLVGVDPRQARAGTLERIQPAIDSLPPRDALLTQARATSPELQAALSRAAAAEAASKAASAAWYPTVRLDSRLMTFGSGSGDYSTEWQTGARVAWPIFTGGSRGAAVDRAQAGSAEARAVVRQIEEELSNRIDQTLAGVSESAGRIAALESAVGHLTEAQRVEALALAQGAGTQTDFLRAEADLAAARSNLARARAAWISARVVLAQLTGTLSPAALAGIVTPER